MGWCCIDRPQVHGVCRTGWDFKPVNLLRVRVCIVWVAPNDACRALRDTGVEVVVKWLPQLTRTEHDTAIAVGCCQHHQVDDLKTCCDRASRYDCHERCQPGVPDQSESSSRSVCC